MYEIVIMSIIRTKNNLLNRLWKYIIIDVSNGGWLMDSPSDFHGGFQIFKVKQIAIVRNRTCIETKTNK